MEKISFSSTQSRTIDQFSSTGAFITPILRQNGVLSVVSVRIETQGTLGMHPAAADQLLWVMAGEAFVSTDKQDEILINAGDAVLWSKGELHQTRAGKAGLQAVIIEGEGLARSIRILPAG